MAVMEGTLSAPLGQTVGQPSGGEARRRAEAATSVLSGNGCRLADLTLSSLFPSLSWSSSVREEERSVTASAAGRGEGGLFSHLLRELPRSSPAGDLL